MNCIIIDDEPLARQGLELMLKNLPNVKVTACFGSALQAISFLKSEQVDVLFLDINMPDLNGMDFVRTVPNLPLIIFITAYPQYALDSYELDAIDYIVKPARIEKLIRAINKAEHYNNLLKTVAIEAKQDDVIEDYVFIKSDRRYNKVFFKDIQYIEGLKDYVVLKLKDKKIITAMNMKTIAAQLPASTFARINKSFLVNVENIESVDTYSVVIDGEEIPLGDHYKQDFINQFIIGKTLGKK